jgi:hypothetical protein
MFNRLRLTGIETIAAIVGGIGAAASTVGTVVSLANKPKTPTQGIDLSSPAANSNPLELNPVELPNSAYAQQQQQQGGLPPLGQAPQNPYAQYAGGPDLMSALQNLQG